MTSISIEALCGLPEKDAYVHPFHAPAPEHRPARDAAYAALTSRARQTAFRTIKQCARAYIRDPRLLDELGADLRFIPIENLIAALAYMMRNPTPYRWFGTGGEIPACNLRGALVYARYRRFKEKSTT